MQPYFIKNQLKCTFERINQQKTCFKHHNDMLEKSLVQTDNFNFSLVFIHTYFQ